MTAYRQIVQLIVALAVLTALFAVLERLWPGKPLQRRLRRGLGTDLVYWFFTPLATKAVSKAAVAAALVPLLLVLGRPLDASSIQAGFGPVTALPAWAQAALILVTGDFIGYWVHRAFHGRWLWKFHAVHHSSTELDWLSSVRLHPVNDVVARVCQAVPFVLLGFSPLVVAAYIPFLTFHAIALHANVSWTFGPLRHVVSSPTFHRWHHTREDEALDRNFGGLLPVWDLLFGTFYMPKGKLPTEFGVKDDAVPEGFLAQLVHPIRRAGRGAGP